MKWVEISDEIELTSLGSVNLAAGGMTPAQVIEKCQAMRSLGFQHLIFNMPNVYEIKPLEILGREVIPQVAGL